MKKRIKKILSNLSLYALLSLPIILIIGIMVLYIIVIAKYGNCPIDEVPFWALLFLKK